jgi:hypothetical protein
MARPYGGNPAGTRNNPMLSEKAPNALAKAYATRGKHRGQLLARCPRSNTLEAAAWQGAMLVCNPYQVGIGVMLFMTAEQKEICEEVTKHFEELPREYQIMAQRDREALECIGAW